MVTMQREAPTAMIDRVSTVLDVFVGKRALTLAEVARRSNLPPSSTHRILQRLVELGWVERSGFDYALGLRMFELGSHVLRRQGLHEAALPVMTQLHRQTGCTVYLSTLVDSDVLHLERVGLWPQSGPSWSVGARQPAELTAPGLALLVAMPPDEWPQLTFESVVTTSSVRSRAHLMRELQRVRDRGGIAVDSQGCALGVTVVAARIDVRNGTGPVALSLCGPTNSVQVEAMVAAVRSGAMEIWYALSGIPRMRNRLVRHASAAAIP